MKINNINYSQIINIVMYLICLFLFCNNVIASDYPAPELKKNFVEIYMQNSHMSPVNFLINYPDSEQFLSTGGNTINLWDELSGRTIRTYQGHTGHITSINISKDKDYFITGGTDDTINLWNKANKYPVLSFKNNSIEGTGGNALSVALINNKYAIVGDSEGTIKIWDVKKKVTTKTIKAHKWRVEKIVMFKDNNRFYSIGADGSDGKSNSLKIWSIDGKLLKTLKNVSSNSVVSRNNEFILYGSDSNSLVQFDIIKSIKLKSFAKSERFQRVHYITKDDKYVVTSVEKILYIWNISTGTIVDTATFNEDIWSAVVSNDDKHIIVGITGGVAYYDKALRKFVKVIKNKMDSSYDAKMSNDNSFIVTAGFNGLRVWNLTARDSYSLPGHAGSVKSVSISNDASIIASGGYDNTVRLWDVNSKSNIKSLVGHTDLVNSIDVSPDNKRLISGSADKTLRIWDIDTGKSLATVKGHVLPVTTVRYSPTGTYMLSSSADVVKLWNADSFNRIKMHANDINLDNNGANQFISEISPDGSNIVMSVKKGEWRLWNLDNNKESIVKVNKVHPLSNWDRLAYSKNGNYLIYNDGADIALLDTVNYNYIKSFKGHTDTISSLSFSHNDNSIVSTSLDGSTILWDVVSGNEKAKFISTADGEWIIITPEGYYNSSANGHNNLNVRFGDKVTGINQFYDVFYRPDIVQAKLNGEDISPLISITIDDAIKSPPPTVKFTNTPSDTSSPMAQVCYQTTSTGGGIGEIRLFQNGKLIKSDGFYRESVAKITNEKRQLVAMNSRAIQDEMRGLVIKEKLNSKFIVSKPKGETYEECVDIETVPGENEISVTAFNSGNTIQSYMQTTSFNSTRTPEVPHLYILAVGIDKYSDSRVNLKYAAKDARDFIVKLPEKARGLYSPQNIHLETILDTQASRAGILDKINELSTKIKPGDSFILFVASHGVLVQDQYYIVTSDYDGNLYDTKKLISSNEIVDMSKKIKSLSQLFIFDTCHAGGVDNIISGLYDARMSVMAKKMGLHIYASAGSVQTAMDGYQGNGLYTHTLLQGIENGKEVDTDHSGKVTVKGLGLYSKEKTTVISTTLGHPQTPLIINFGKDNPLFLVQ